MTLLFRSISKEIKKQEVITDDYIIDTVLDVMTPFNAQGLYFPYDKSNCPQELKDQILNVYRFVNAKPFQEFTSIMNILFKECLTHPEVQKLINRELDLYLFAFEYDIIRDFFAIRLFNNPRNATPNPKQILRQMDDPAAVTELIATFDENKFNLDEGNMKVNASNLKVNTSNLTEKKKCVIS